MLIAQGLCKRTEISTDKSPPKRTSIRANPPLLQSSCAHSLEPILFPKLRIYFADFPYLHYSNQLEAVHLGDLLRLSVRLRKKIIFSLGFSRRVKKAPDRSKSERLFHPKHLFSGQTDFKVFGKVSTRKENSFQASCLCPQVLLCYHLDSLSQYQNINWFPFRCVGPKTAQH
jgi:hypothetical protein